MFPNKENQTIAAMKFLKKIESWGNAHRIAVIDYLRVIVGFFIAFKGIEFVLNSEAAFSLTGNMDHAFIYLGATHYVLFFNVLGGFLIAMGLFTRFISLLQLPVLIGALTLVNYSDGLLTNGSFTEIIVLAFLIVLLIFGSGKFSIDHLRRIDQERFSKLRHL